MGRILVDSPASLAEEIAGERCDISGGHQFERDLELSNGSWVVVCANCGREGVELPDNDEDGPLSPLCEGL